VALKGSDVFYLENIAMFKAIYSGDTLILPEAQADTLGDRVLDTSYYYFTPEALEGLSNKKNLVPEVITKELKYDTFVPSYNTGAQKVRSVTAKESNYFNILQSIAETFGAWLKLKIDRDDEGGIISKTVLFKNYVGQENYAGFKYGINLKDI
jgi:hypothetical protein